MAKPNYYEPLITHLENRSVESTVSILGITDPQLRSHLKKQMGDKAAGTAFLGDSVFEATFPWEPAEKRMMDISGEGELLSQSLVTAMDEAEGHRFGQDWNPFKHQLLAWKTLLEEEKSVVVTSGTGSGKTECFMIPVLNDLAREFEQGSKPLEGVRALFLYPLNALINSQRERLRAWTSAYKGAIKFCLYNGNTEENKHRDQGKFPNEILTRKQLRESPSPILVTNATMLEYMLVRQNDAPIIEKSKGKLRWLILDEAHTYIGSQAAELSLLLRRVMHSFGVNAKDVRFVATSATIGSKDAERKLQQYLADLAGIHEDQIVVVGGRRVVPSLEQVAHSQLSIEDIKAIDRAETISAARYNALAEHPISRALRAALTDESDLHPRLSTLSIKLFGDESKQNETLAWIDLCSYTSTPGPNPKRPDIDSTPFLPVRGHLFHQVMSGLWCCVDRNCKCKSGTDLEGGWPFGFVYSERKQNCECGAPVFELVFCRDCNQPHLMAGEDDKGNLFQFGRESVDEFSLDIEEGEEDGSGEDAEGEVLGSLDRTYFSPRSHESLTYSVALDPVSYARTSPDENTINLFEVAEKNVCACCEYQSAPSPFRHAYLGTPFYVSNTIPSLLEACQDGDKPNEQPCRGRRLIAFTDSRQGTARISVKMQQDSERDSLRGMVYQTVAQNRGGGDPAERAEIEARIKSQQQILENLESAGVDGSPLQQIRDLLDKDLEKLNGLTERKAISWDELVEKLRSAPDIERWAFDYYRNLNRELFPDTGGTRVLTELFLLREFGRRPKRANSLETLGLVRVVYPGLESVTQVPSEWKALNLDLGDWKDFLKIALDFFIRENTIFAFPLDWTNWIGAQIYPKSLMKFDSSEKTSARLKKWPQAWGKRNNRLVRIIEAAAGVSIDNPATKDYIDKSLQAAWETLASKTKLLKPAAGTNYFQLDRSELAFASVSHAWICPITHRLLDVTLKGITPYLPFNTQNADIRCRRVDLDAYEVDEAQFSSREERLAHTRQWLSESAHVLALRDENLWTDVSDRVLEGAAFYRAVEHSAQLPASTLETYEAKFKAGKVNVLSCSTTMEMGVDIGGISVVAMNNVPPHPANYLQRAGRAGRRGETQAVAFTICKDNPHERSVFKDTQWPFKTKVPAPYIALNSEPLVQRHINSLLMSVFLNDVCKVDGEKSAITLNCGWFYVKDDDRSSHYEEFCSWLDALHLPSIPTEIDSGLSAIKKGSVLSGHSNKSLIENALEAVRKTANVWLSGYRKLKIELDNLDKIGDTDLYKRKLAHDVKRATDEYLLKELAANAFLPGYGFPTGVVCFDHYSIHDFKSGKYRTKSGRIDNLLRMRDRPSRDLPVAIREYAPGSDVVIDGKSYRSAGILLDVNAPDSGYTQPQKLMVEWRCSACGQIDRTFGGHFDGECTVCGSSIKQENHREFIEPKGFAVDFYSEPSTDVTHQSYIPVKEPWVTAGGELHSLYEPRLGAYKVSSQGHIFHHSGGEHDKGYAVCLRCGRSESMAIDGELPAVFAKPHKRLQGKSGAEGDAICLGSDEPYAIKAGVYLGSADQTDVFELFLKHPVDDRYLSQRDGPELLWTLAVVFRQALADIHGITADEIGYSVRPDNSSMFESAVEAIVLFDRCGGGAGFSSAAPFHIKELFLRAVQYLDCRDGCDSACQSCLLGYDTRFHNSLLNRFVAKQYLDAILPFLEMPKEARLLGEGTQFCVGNFDSEVIRLATSYEKVSLFISSFDKGCSVSAANLKDRCFKYLEVFDHIELVFSHDDLNQLLDSQREDLWALSRFGVEIRVSSEPINSSIIGQLTGASICRTFASNMAGGTRADENYLSFDGAYCVFSDDVSAMQTLPYVELKPVRAAGDVELELRSECDGLLSDFGGKLWKRLIESHPDLATKIGSGIEIKSISYVDSYVASPITLLMFAETIEGLKSLLGANWSNPSISLRSGIKDKPSRGYGLYGEWDNSAVQQQVFGQTFEYMGESLEVELTAIKDLPHDRTLAIHWSDGSLTNVRFDHGFGPWSMTKEFRPSFNFDEAINRQVDRLYDVLPRLKLEKKGAYATLLFVKHKEEKLS